MEMRGYFGIGAEGVSDARNVATLMRTAHAFGASFVFTVAADYRAGEGNRVDTSHAPEHLPFYSFPDAAALDLPQGCRLVGVELVEKAVALPSFRHPQAAAYVLGSERGSLTPAMLARCEFVVRIPMRFCVNLGIAGAIVMYDRMLSLGRFAERPVRAGGPAAPAPRHVHGKPRFRSAERKGLYRNRQPGEE